MKTIKVKLAGKFNHTYSIHIGENLGEKIADYLLGNSLGNKYAIITDTKVKNLYGNTLLKFLRKKGVNTELLAFAEGEKNKNLGSLEKLANEMIAKGFDRKDAIIALGGGVVGDLGGLLASIYMRGIPYLQIPTTLMAMVDSSVGGKTAIDLQSGKNLLGTFAQPKAVFIDTKYLKTLPLSQIRNGLAEVIKYGVIKDEKLFKLIEQNLNKILELEPDILYKIITRSVSIKAKIVEKDEKESGERMILNYGHTFGHALEKLSNFKLLHGYAISIGMTLDNNIAQEKGLLTAADAERIKKLISKAGLPTTTMNKPTMKEIMSDKKRQGDYLFLILPNKIGKVIIQKEKCQ